MCGICGVFQFDPQSTVSREHLAEMSRQIVHRGPDDEGVFLAGNIGLAARRLSIIDVRSGHQPMSNEDETVWLVYNGEIYNHQELRRQLTARGHHYRTHSDTEVILHLYEEHGIECVQYLRGMFAFALWDAPKRKLFAARDRFGIKPFYYLYDRETFLFASEIKALLAYPGVKATLHEDALPEYLAFGYLSRPETLFKGIVKLPPGHALQLDQQGELKIQPYWDVVIDEEPRSRPLRYYIDTYREQLEAAVASHLMSDVPLGMFLSGGLDSSTIAALMTKIRREPIQTFSVGYDEREYSELGHARAVANHLRSDHHEISVTSQEFFDAMSRLIWQEDEPMAWPSSVALFFLSKFAREHVTVVLTGEGSDETLAGYTRYAWTLWNTRFDHAYRVLTPSRLRRFGRSAIRANKLGAGLSRKLQHTFLGRDGTSWSSFYFDNFYSAFSADEQSELFSDRLRAQTANPYSATMKFWNRSRGDLLHRMLYTDVRTYLVELLMKQDNISMAASLESRVPFLDHALGEFALNIPSAFSTKGISGKCILKAIAKDLLPPSIVHRGKAGFPTPWPLWLQQRLDQIEQMLTEPRSANRDLFQPHAIKRIFREQRARHCDHADRIWRLLNLEVWHRVFIDRDPKLLSADETNAGVIQRG